MPAPRHENPFIVQSDHTVLVEVESPRYREGRDALARFAELVKSPEHVHTYRISPLSIWNACAAGVRPEWICAARRIRRDRAAVRGRKDHRRPCVHGAVADLDADPDDQCHGDSPVDRGTHGQNHAARRGDRGIQRPCEGHLPGDGRDIQHSHVAGGPGGRLLPISNCSISAIGD